MFDVSSKAPVDEASYQLIDFFTMELILLGGIVLIAFVLIARRSKAR